MPDGVDAIEGLPAPSPTRLAVRVTADAQRRLRAGHPWLYDGSIRSVSRDGAPGDLAVVFDDERRFVAIGLWDPSSPIRVKVLHAGKPATIDAAWFEAAIARAVAVRDPLAATAGTSRETTGYRVVHGENDGLPGLVLDRYDDTLVLKLYTTAWIPHLATVVPAIDRVLAPRRIVLRLSRAAAARPVELHGLGEGVVLHGDEVVGPVPFREHGLRFEADVVHGQKTGHFLDQRDNRARVGELSHGSRVLDVFCSSGGFSVHAAAGGATAVVSVDSSPHAVEAAARHVVVNGDRPAVRACAHETVVGDAFETMQRLGTTRRRFDVVVVDPPSFAHDAASVPRALAAYGRLTALALPLLARDGVLVQASCSSRVTMDDFAHTIHRAAGEAGWELDELWRAGHPLDHPVGFAEGAYLKALSVRPQRRPIGYRQG